MCSAPSPYSPPIPKPALTIVGKTRIAPALLASSRPDQTSRKKSSSVARTLASISGGDAAWARGARQSAARNATTAIVVLLISPPISPPLCRATGGGATVGIGARLEPEFVSPPRDFDQ